MRKERSEPTKDNRSLADPTSANREDMYGFLAYLLTQNPDKDFVDHLSSDEEIAQLRKLEESICMDGGSEDLLASLRRIVSILASWRDDDQRRLMKLREDHARLFRGISRKYGPPPPYESVYRSNVVMSDHASEVLELYHRAGLEVREGEPPDHIGLELAFMAYLCKKENEHDKEGDSERASEFSSFQREFLSGHVMKWIPQFCSSVTNYDSIFYSAAAELTVKWLKTEEMCARRAKDSLGGVH